MKKLKLNVEELTVESFRAENEPAKPAGTVKGAQDSLEACSEYYSMCGEPSICEDASCNWTHCRNISCAYQCSEPE